MMDDFREDYYRLLHEKYEMEQGLKARIELLEKENESLKAFIEGKYESTITPT